MNFADKVEFKNWIIANWERRYNCNDGGVTLRLEFDLGLGCGDHYDMWLNFGPGEHVPFMETLMSGSISTGLNIKVSIVSNMNSYGLFERVRNDRYHREAWVD